MNISPEHQLLFACARQNFTEEHQQTVLTLCRTHAVDWEAVYQTSQLHGVACLIYASLQRCAAQGLKLPAEIEAAFRQQMFSNILNKEKLAQNIVRAFDHFNQKTIQIMLIKGAALDLLIYDQPYYMTLLDADLVINAKRSEISEAEWKENRHFFHRSSIEYDYFEHHDVVMNGALPVDFQTIWRDARQIDFRGRKLYVMSPEDLLITGCINSCRKRYFRLKSLCDLAETISRFPDLDWTLLADKARAYQCSLIVFAALYVTKLTVGCSLPGDLRERLGVSPLRAKAICYLVERLSLTAYGSIYSGKDVLNRKLDYTLVLSYVTFQWPQIWRRLKFVWLYAAGEKRREFTWPRIARALS
jgi:hypothetical protein